MTEQPLSPTKSPTFVRALGPIEGTCIVVGTVIGSGIFLTPSSIAERLAPFGFGTIILVWIVGGLLSLAGALSYAELAAMFPRAGGQYVYLREAYGPTWAFLYGWMEFWVARSGSIAALAVAFAQYAGHFTHLESDWDRRWTAFLLVAVLTAVNYAGVRWGAAVQVLFTATKVAALTALIACAFGMGAGKPDNWLPLWPANLGPDAWSVIPGAFGLALVATLWAYDGWANGAAVSEEVKDPQRNVPRVLLLGTLTITAIYLGANLAYHYVFPPVQVAVTERVASAVADRLFGPVGAALVAAAVMISTSGAANGVLLTGPRIFYAMARDGLFFRQMGELHFRFRTPTHAILFQGLWASVLILVPFQEMWNGLFPAMAMKAPLFDQLFTFVIFASWVFYGTSVAAVIVLRRKRPDAERPYRAWGYPVFPILFVLAAAAFVLNTVVRQPAESLTGIVIVLLGLPAYRAWSRRAAG